MRRTNVVRVVGVDGCPGGWLAMAFDGSSIEPHFHPTFSELVQRYSEVSCIAIDIPIGLSSTGARACDLAARRLLGRRRSSVFPAPDPRILDYATHAEASAQSRVLTGKGLSIQSFGIYPKVAEVHRLMTPLLQSWIVEVHPEVSFWALAGGHPLEHTKRRAAGYEERAELLAGVLGVRIPDRKEARSMTRPCSPDDVLDAIVAAWTASRVVDGIAERLPVNPERDVSGLRMEIVY
jgi:predicted RNase H-like nuclease